MSTFKIKAINVLSSRQRRRRRAAIINYDIFNDYANRVQTNTVIVTDTDAVNSNKGNLNYLTVDNNNVNDNQQIPPYDTNDEVFRGNFNVDLPHKLTKNNQLEPNMDETGGKIELDFIDISRPSVKSTCLSEDLKEWLISSNISHQTGNKLLEILNKHSIKNVPKDVRTLVKTPRSVITYDVPPGKYVHFGLKKGLQKAPYF